MTSSIKKNDWTIAVAVLIKKVTCYLIHLKSERKPEYPKFEQSQKHCQTTQGGYCSNYF